MLLATGLYLYDSLLLLRHDELVLVQSAQQLWRPAFGANGWKIAGKEPMLPNPLAPWRPLARVRWKLEQGLAEAPAAIVQLPRIGLLPRAGVALLWLLVFVALPLCLFAFKHAELTLGVIATMYACMATVLVSIRRDWLAQGLVSGRFWMIALECVACPPFCINAVRRVSLLVVPRISLSDIAKEEGANGRLDALKWQLQLRVNEVIDALPEGSAKLQALEATAKSLARGGDA